MPRYNYRCVGSGWAHELEQWASREQREFDCPEHGRPAQRIAVYPGAVPGVTGAVTVPVSQRYIPLKQAQEAHDEIVYESERAGVEPPDLVAAGMRQAAMRRKYLPETIGE